LISTQIHWKREL